MTPTLTALTADIKTAIAGALHRGFDRGGFELTFSHSTLVRLHEQLEPLGFNFVGMGYTESEITVTLQMSDSFTEACGNNIFHYCQFSISNDGEFGVEVVDANLDETLNMNLTTPYDQHIFSKATSEQIDAAAENLRMAFQTQLLRV